MIAFSQKQPVVNESKFYSVKKNCFIKFVDVLYINHPINYPNLPNCLVLPGIMMLWLTENDLKTFFGEVVRNVAKELKIKGVLWKNPMQVAKQLNDVLTSVQNRPALYALTG